MKIQDKTGDSPRDPNTVFISIPKKIVRLATERNRLKRLLREALRANPELKKSGKVYFLRVTQRLERPALQEVLKTLKVLM